jgi:hypothetical protein
VTLAFSLFYTMESPLKGCKALVCDVFGTCVDCETSLVHNLRELFTSQDFGALDLSNDYVDRSILTVSQTGNRLFRLG